MTAAIITTNAVSPRDTAFASELRRSLLQILNNALLRRSRATVSRSLREVRDALDDGSLDAALRRMDSAWRCLPGEIETLAPIYGRLLSLEARDHEAALGLLERAAKLAPDPDVAALIALAHLRLQHPEQARLHLESALAEFCVVPGALLSQLAGEIMRSSAVSAPGWIGHGPSLELVGELSPDVPSNVLDIRIDGRPAFTQLLRISDASECQFSIPSPRVSPPARLDVYAGGELLLGSGCCKPSQFAVDGRIANRGRSIVGWARIGWLPARAPRLRISDEKGRRAAVATASVALPGNRWPFKIDAHAAGLRGTSFHLSAQLPDGRWEGLPDSPLLLEPAVRLRGRKPPPLRKWAAGKSRPALRPAANTRDRLIDVIIPVYRGREETLACIDAVLATVGRQARTVVIDDASDDPVLAAALDSLARGQRIMLIRNATNRGFVASVNRGLRVHPTHDVVLLNSDTLVFDDWLARLRAAAYSAAAVGTVTPFSNSGSITSYPRAEGAAIEPEAAAALHAFAASTHPGISVEIPVGVGFCLYLRRDCLSDVGELDAAVFGKGYGEENDFCLRARSRGWSHRLAADVFVYHAGAVSFGGRRAALLDRSERLLNLRHPGYSGFIASFLAQDSLHVLRRRFDERRLLAFAGRFVLLVTLAMSGGVERFVAERCRVLRARGLFPLMLRPCQAGDASRCELFTDALELPNLRYEIPQDLAALILLLGDLRLEAIEIQHFLHLDARVVEAVRALPLPYDVFVHDYAWICPRVTLIDGSGRYCGEPAVTVCQACVRRNGSSLGEAISVAALRVRSAKWLHAARKVIAPSDDTGTRLEQHFTDLAVEVQPHTRPVMPASPPPRSRHGDVVRVALIGAIGDHKGYRVLLDCARDARTRRLPIEFIVIGYTRKDAPLLATGKVFITGRYTEGEAPHLLQREQPDLAWLPSVWPETWCYTLDYALEAGLPVAAFDLGAIAERLRGVRGAVLLPWTLEGRDINDHFLRLAGRSGHQASAEPRSVQSKPSRRGDDGNMRAALVGERAMNKTPDGKPAQDVQVDPLSASVQILPLPAGLYLFSVKAASPLTVKSIGQLSLPAVHVGLGPGVRSEDVEFISGPSTHGAWLFAPGDLLVAKTKGIGATLIMTSVRAPGGEVLSIKVERLESRADGQSAARVPNANVAIQSASPRLAGQPPHEASESAFGSATSDLNLPVQIGAHIRTRGDMSFVDAPWAGRVAPGLWIESFSVRPLKRLKPQDIEYKALTGSGFETPWLTEDKMCGTKGMAVPLVGFAVRLKPGLAADSYDCEYSGYFQSGLTVGPLRNGVPCRSSVANDPLEGIQIRLIKRSAAVLPPGTAQGATPAKQAKPGKRAGGAAT